MKGKRTRTPGIYARTLRDGRTVYDVSVEVGTAGGPRRQQQFRGVESYEAAQAKRSEVLVARRQGGYTEPSKQTVAEFMDEWLAAKRATVRPSTHDGYVAKVRQHIAPRIGSLPLQGLSGATLNALYADLLTGGRHRGEGGLSPRSVRYVHTIIHKALKDAVRWKKVPTNVADDADPPREDTPEMPTWSAEELRRFLGQVRGDRLYAVWVLLATTGMRRGEVLGLRWADVDVTAGTVDIRRALVPVGYAVEFSKPKTPRSRRQIPLDVTTVAALREHRKQQAEERLALGPAYQGGDLVVATENGAPVHPDRLSKMFQAHVRAAGLPRIRLHDLRHTYATLALRAGVHPKVVSERLGHANISLTLDRYSHAIPAMQAEAADKVAGLIFGNG